MEIREVHQDMVDAVKAFLANREEMRDSNNWNGLFNYTWKPEGLPYGYAIFEEDRMIGFLGTIFSERLVEGKTQICCNTTCWFVEPEFRSQMQALRLFAPILKMKDLLITNMTPSDDAVKICERFGYKPLDPDQIVVPVLPVWTFGGKKNLLVTFDPDAIAGHLGAEEQRIFQDHSGLACKHFLIKELRSGEHCYGIATTSPLNKLRRWGGQWLNLCYLSDANVFRRNYPHLRFKLLREGRFFLLRYDARLLPGRLSRFEMRSEKVRQYRSAEPLSWTIDNLYSELVTFNKY
jgi:hypothetical protein